jgi:two-component system chemotaxis response regulator CheY
VDDHAMSRLYTVAALRQNGATVKVTGKPQTALAIALRWLPDAICTDLQLPGMGGQELIHRIRQGWPADRPPPLIVVLSADPAPLSPRQPPLVDRVLIKPATPAQLRAALAQQFTDRVMEGGREAVVPPTATELQQLFRQELALRLPDLENRLARKELSQVRAILHQLVASSRLCGDRRLEADLQALHAACQDNAHAADVGRRYCDLLADAGHYLGSTCRGSASCAPGAPRSG